MSDQQTEEKTTPAEGETSTSSAQDSKEQAPQIDEAALAQNITDNVTGAVTDTVTQTVTDQVNAEVQKQMQETFAALSGVNQKPTPHALHTAFAKTPSELFEENRKIAKEEMRTELRAEKQNEQECITAMQPVYDKYPELKKYGNEVRADFDALAALEENRNKTDAQILEKSLDRTVERLEFKGLSDEEIARNAMLPAASGGVPQGSPIPVDADKAALDFINQGKDTFRSLRVPKAN